MILDALGAVLRMLGAVFVLGVAFGCGEFETAYFRERVNQVTQEVVAQRYGSPHKLEKQPEGSSVWTYYVRGSGTIGYGGYARAAHCRAYVLTFDSQDVLRDWREENCGMKPAVITDPFSDRN